LIAWFTPRAAGDGNPVAHAWRNRHAPAPDRHRDQRAGIDQQLEHGQQQDRAETPVEQDDQAFREFGREHAARRQARPQVVLRDQHQHDGAGHFGFRRQRQRPEPAHQDQQAGKAEHQMKHQALPVKNARPPGHAWG
jgi:hypothetical protein